MPSPAVRTVLLGSTYTPQAKALFARMTNRPSAQRARLIDACIRSLLASGVWAKLDALYVMAAADSQAASLNWIANQYNLTAVNSPTFTADRGYTGDGASAYLGTSASGSSLAQFSLNSAHVSVWQLTNVQSLHAISSTGANAFIQPRTSSDKYYVRANDGGGALGTVSVTDSRGLTTINRSGSTARQLYKNGSLVTTDAQVSTTIAGTFQILGITGGFSVGQEAVATIGGSLSATQEAAKYAAFNSYLVGVGAV